MEKVGVSKLRANLPLFLKKIEQGETIAVTSRGREIARLVPPEKQRQAARQALQKLSKTAIVGDIVSPTGEIWEAMQ
jgi:prevent-host-death family protein